MSFTASGSRAKYLKTQVDGVDVSAAQVAIDGSGDTAVTLSPAYLQSITGTHTVRIVYTDGYAETNFTVTAESPASDTVATGERGSALVNLSLSLTGIAVFFSLIALRKRKLHNSRR